MVWGEMSSDFFFPLMLVLPVILQIEQEIKQIRKNLWISLRLEGKKEVSWGLLSQSFPNHPFPHRG